MMQFAKGDFEHYLQRTIYLLSKLPANNVSNSAGDTGGTSTAALDLPDCGTAALLIYPSDSLPTADIPSPDKYPISHIDRAPISRENV
jgi:hypothetical protein